VIHSRVESGEILAQRPQVAQGGPKGKISKLSQHVDNARQCFMAYPLSIIRSKALETCLPVSLPLLHSSIIEKLGVGK
jgi:hypothetical protein